MRAGLCQPLTWRKTLSDIKWTTAAELNLFERLTKTFGPHSKWEMQSRPGRELNQQYKEFCEAFGLVMGTTGEAVSQRIDFVLQAVHHTARWNSAHAVTGIRCLTAAWMAGFVKASEMPSLVVAPNEMSAAEEFAVASVNLADGATQ
jgi:hypothetical protein